MALLEFTNKGIFCPPAKVYIDPWRPVDRALITHGHADHSRWGHKHYLCTELAAPVIRYRLGNVNLSTLGYGESINIDGVKFSFHPAGHIIGSAQIRVEHKGEIWVASGDYKLEADGLCTPFEPIKCHAFITESTFGLPVYQWKPQQAVFDEINSWWKQNKADGKTSVLAAYALGKAQRLLNGIDEEIGPIYTHGAIEKTNQVIRKQGIKLPHTTRITQQDKSKDYEGALVIATPAATGSNWMKRFKSASIGIASGWMALRGTRRRRAADRGFILSDHADWTGLNEAIKATGAERVAVTHGYSSIFARWLREECGLEAWEADTEYEGESLDKEDNEEVDQL
ncbi:MAG: ligase-associated DNA damage response exonuclease [Phaeodactylibacter sp.]|nr:ligase-associated DNA damage response exonuclease [Phaeodactylibacter sp.]